MKRRHAVGGEVSLTNTSVVVSIAVGGTKAGSALDGGTESVHGRRGSLAGILKECWRALRAVEVASSTERALCHVESRRTEIVLLMRLKVVQLILDSDGLRLMYSAEASVTSILRHLSCFPFVRPTTGPR